MSDLRAALLAEADPPCLYKGGMGTTIRRMQALLRRVIAEMDALNAADAKLMLIRACEAEGQGAFARRHSIPQSVVSEVVTGRRGMPESIANALGLIQQTTYRRIAKGNT